MVIDFHTHCFPDFLAEKAVKKLESSGGTKAFTDGTRNGLLKSMKKNNIDYSVIMQIATTPKQTVSVNDDAIRYNGKDNTFYFGSIHPHYEDIEAELKRLKKSGVMGIKLHPDFQGVYINDGSMINVMKLATDMGMIITIHCGMDISFPDVHRSTPKLLSTVLPEIPGARIICAHMGGYMYLDEFEEYLLNKDGIYIDTSFSFGHMDENKIMRILNKSDPDKILFGTDSPWDDQGKTLKKIISLPLSDNIKEKILHKNACKLLNIG